MLHERTYKSGSKRRRATALLAAAFLSAAGLVAVTPAEAAAPDDAGLFELDANVISVSSTTEPGDDWSDIFDEYGTDEIPGPIDASDAFASTGILHDPSPESIFTQGGSKDYLDVTEWRHKDGNVPDKDEITDAYAAAYAGTGTDDDAYVYFGMDRFATEGSANLGFWFLQDDQFGLGEGDTFSGRHQEGDVLVLSEFDEGGANPTIKVFKWVEDGTGNEGGGILRTLFGGSAGQVAKCGDSPTGRAACAAVNIEPVPDAETGWVYESKKDRGQVQRDIPPAAFFEGGINLTELFGGSSEDTPCFSSFVAETRSSFEVSAVLKDLVAGEFDLCSADISITPDGVNDVGDAHPFTVEVTKSVAGADSPVPGIKPTVTIKDAAGNTVTDGIDTSGCDAGTDALGQCVVTLTSDEPGTFTARASATVTIGGSNIAVSTGNAEGQNPDAVKEFVDARITISPDDTNGIGEPHTFVVGVEENRGSGFVPATTGHVDYTLTDAGGAVSTVDPTETTCHAKGVHTAADTADNLSDTTVGTVPAGSCTITFSSATAGTVTRHATVTLQYDGPDEGTTAGDDPVDDLTITRDTDGVADDPATGSTNSDDALKTYVDGSLSWLKHDGEGNLLGGATFQVCQTESYNSETETFVDTADNCVSVSDDSDGVAEGGTTDVDPDADGDAGEFLLENLALGTYTIKETAAPSGYQIDPDTETVSMDIDAPNGDPRNTDGTPKPFVNPALFKLIVLTCNQVTGELVDSTVTLDDGDPTTTDDTKETLTVDTPDGLCDTGGAAYGNLPPGTYTPSVELPDRGEPFPTP